MRELFKAHGGAVRGEGVVSGEEVDRLCRDYLRARYSDELSELYENMSLLTPDLNTEDLNGALGDLLTRLAGHFGPDECFLGADYDVARSVLGLSDGRTPLPAVFRRIFSQGSHG